MKDKLQEIIAESGKDSRVLHNPHIKLNLSLAESLLEAVTALEEVRKCFYAAEVEGLAERLRHTEDDEPGSLKDLVERRLMFADNEACSAIARIEARFSDKKEGA